MWWLMWFVYIALGVYFLGGFVGLTYVVGIFWVWLFCFNVT